MNCSASSFDFVPRTICAVAGDARQPSLGNTIPTGLPCAISTCSMLLLIATTTFSWLTSGRTSPMLWKYLRTLGPSRARAAKPGSRFSYEPPLSTLACRRNRSPGVSSIAPGTTIPLKRGCQRSAHEAGGSTVRSFVLNPSTRLWLCTIGPYPRGVDRIGREVAHARHVRRLDSFEQHRPRSPCPSRVDR